MASKRSSRFAVIAFVICFAGSSSLLGAQSLELMPFGGYRFGGDFFELVAERPVDLDGSPAVGFVLNVPLSDGLQVEAMITHQNAHLSMPGGAVFSRNAPAHYSRPPARWRIARVRRRPCPPLLTGVLGLTRYAAEGNSEVRFTLGAGGGVKLFPFNHIGFRLDGRLYTTFIDADAKFLACAPGTCITAVHVDVVWQAEFSPGIIFRLR